MARKIIIVERKSRMKRYKLLKDLPFAKAGDIFKGELEYGTTVLFPEDYENYKHKLSSDEFWDFDEWFEEVKEIKKIDLAEHFFIILGGRVDIIKFINYTYSDETEQEYIKKKEECKSVGNCFETREEAEKYLEYLKAKEVIKQDTKGFKPNWEDGNETKFFGYWDFILEEPDCGLDYRAKTPNVYFQSLKDIKESFEKHPEEWKTYLTYDQ